MFGQRFVWTHVRAPHTQKGHVLVGYPCKCSSYTLKRFCVQYNLSRHTAQSYTPIYDMYIDTYIDISYIHWYTFYVDANMASMLYKHMLSLLQNGRQCLIFHWHEAHVPETNSGVFPMFRNSVHVFPCFRRRCGRAHQREEWKVPYRNGLGVKSCFVPTVFFSHVFLTHWFMVHLLTVFFFQPGYGPCLNTSIYGCIWIPPIRVTEWKGPVLCGPQSAESYLIWPWWKNREWALHVYQWRNANIRSRRRCQLSNKYRTY